MALPTAPIAAGSLLGGYLTARATKIRPLGGAVLAAGGVYMTNRSRKQAGLPTAGILLATYLGGFGASHPLAKKIGAWPSVLTVAAISGTASYVLADRVGAKPASTSWAVRRRRGSSSTHAPSSAGSER
jgi:hypothetical protein